MSDWRASTARATNSVAITKAINVAVIMGVKVYTVYTQSKNFRIFFRKYLFSFYLGWYI